MTNYIEILIDRLQDDDSYRARQFRTLAERSELEMFSWSDERWLEEYDDFSRHNDTMLRFAARVSEVLVQYPLLDFRGLLDLLAAAYDVARENRDDVASADALIGGWARTSDDVRDPVEELAYLLLTDFETRWPDTVPIRP